MLCLLEGKLEPCRWLKVRRASRVFDAVPRDIVEPLKVNDLFMYPECLLTSKQVLPIIGGEGGGGGEERAAVDA